LVICSKPGGVIRLFPWLDELTASIYAAVKDNASETIAKNLADNPADGCLKKRRVSSQTVIHAAGRGRRRTSRCEIAQRGHESRDFGKPVAPDKAVWRQSPAAYWNPQPGTAENFRASCYGTWQTRFRPAAKLR